MQFVQTSFIACRLAYGFYQSENASPVSLLVVLVYASGSHVPSTSSSGTTPTATSTSCVLYVHKWWRGKTAASRCRAVHSYYDTNNVGSYTWRHEHLKLQTNTSTRLRDAKNRTFSTQVERWQVPDQTKFKSETQRAKKKTRPLSKRFFQQRETNNAPSNRVAPTSQ